MQDIQIGVIGAGTMGLRMLQALQAQPGYAVTGVHDPDPRAQARVRVLAPGLPVLANAAELVSHPGLDALYIASPPAWHLEHLRMARDAGLAVLCEQPLAANKADLALIGQLDLPRCAVNFPFACAPAARQLMALARSGALGAFTGASVTLRFARWPRAWQDGAAGWLASPEQGGFTREVLSHFLFLALRLLGPLELQSCHLVRAPGYTETALRARLRHAAGNFEIDAAIGGTAEESMRFEWRGSHGSASLSDWYRLEATGLSPLEPVDPAPCTLDAFARALTGKAGSDLATVAEARKVAELVESMLA
ncbi:MAG TPA: Gfo/Idh/MocA family oxidoreductase [Telluria sp.]